MLSMTGFASLSTTLHDAHTKTVHLSCMVKSINSRYFEVMCKLPPSLQSLEIEAISIARQELIRGKCTLIIQCSDPAYFKNPIQPSLSAIGNYLEAAELVQQTYNVAGQVTISDLLLIPDLFTSIDSVIKEVTKEEILKLVKKACTQLTESRATEGAALAKDILARSVFIRQAFAEVSQRAQANSTQRQQKITTELQALDLSKDADLIRYQLTTELNRADVTEELVRFASHLDSLHSIIDKDATEQGRHIDFTLQELVREINTIAAKSSDAVIGKLVISIKVELEKIREQVQNIL